MKSKILPIIFLILYLNACESPNENDSSDLEWIEEFSIVNNGEGVVNALGYDFGANSVPHKIVLIGEDGKPFEDFNKRIPSSWLPSSVEETQLVGICERGWEIIQTCDYGAAGTIHIKRRRDRISIDLFDAKTGEPAKNTIYEVWGITAGASGGMPPVCPTTSGLGGGNLDGEPVKFIDIINSLEETVDP